MSEATDSNTDEESESPNRPSFEGQPVFKGNFTGEYDEETDG